MMKSCLNIIYQSDYNDRENGSDCPQIAHTMIWRKRLDNIQFLVEDCINNNIDGDLIEIGVWRGQLYL